MQLDGELCVVLRPLEIEDCEYVLLLQLFIFKLQSLLENLN